MSCSLSPSRLATILLAIIVGGCSRGVFLAPNQPPTLELTSGPIDTSSAAPVAWSVEISWDARDVDGTVVHVAWAVDPPTAAESAAGAETSWVRTKTSSVVARFRATRPDSLGPGATASDFHVFVARAWDNSGAASPQVVRAFYAYTVAPTVAFTRPAPDRLRAISAPPSFDLTFAGDDPDGLDSRTPAGYLVRLLLEGQPLTQVLDHDPDSLRREGVAHHWQGWSTLPGSETRFPIRDLPDGTTWTAAIAAVDEAGAISPLFSFDRNLLRVVVDVGSGPRLQIRGPGLDYTYLDGSGVADSSRWRSVSYPAGSTSVFSWSSIAATGRTITGYRWVLDPDALGSTTPRSDEVTDTRHWSRWDVNTRSTGSLGPWPAGEHFLYVQAEDDLGSRSYAIVRIRAFPVSFERSLLVVDDTRLEVDRFASGGCLVPYTKPWPSAAELDTFLYAVGGVPWRCAVNPPGAASVPGLFAGYDVDTVGTRAGAVDMSQVVPLSLLTHYRHVLWLTDLEGALSTGTQSTVPFTMMRWMSRPGNLRVLEAYTQLGGRLWIAGGGAALASLADGDQKSNNTSSNTVFAPDVDLAPTSIVVLAGHLRGRMAVTRGSVQFVRSAAARGGWSGHGVDGTLAAPDYTGLPSLLRLRDSATDPLPPTRPASQANLFYVTSAAAEYSHGNNWSEDFGAPGSPRVEAALDTLLEVVGGTIQSPPGPAMLYYHGRENGSVLFSGLDLWSWSRSDAQALVDFVLQDVWGVTRSSRAGMRAKSPGPTAAVRMAPQRARANVTRLRTLDPPVPRP